jgi:XRE family aerobic/anaerobic benzoate catabolism transcriptional regulator
MSLAKRFAKNLRAIRLGKGLSQKALSDATGLTVRYLSKLENSDPNVTLGVLEKLAKALECSVFDLLGESEKSQLKWNGDEIEQAIRILTSLRARLS